MQEEIEKDTEPAHPGIQIRQEIIPSGMTAVTKAAIMLGICRPALSNLLNENAALSQKWPSGWRRCSGPPGKGLDHPTGPV